MRDCNTIPVTMATILIEDTSEKLCIFDSSAERDVNAAINT